MENTNLKVVLALVIGIAIGWFATKFTAIPTITKNENIPVITNPVSSPTVTPKITTKPANVTDVKYFFPSGWKTISDVNKTIEAGYDPVKYKPGETQNGIELWEIVQGSYRTPDWVVVKIYPYDGGSRHQFFYNVWGSTPLLSEMGMDENLMYGTKSCLAIHKMKVSQWNSEWVMCDIGNGKALVVSTRNPQSLLATLKTVKLLR